MADLRDKGVIKHSTSPFNAPTFTVDKRDDTGRKTDNRVVHDYRALNRATIVQEYPMPLVWDLIDHFEGCNFFTVLDIRSAFHQIPMNPAHEHYTAFTVGYMKYQYLRMPFGLAGGPATMQSSITNAFRDLLGRGISIYMDDLTIATPTAYHHERILTEVFERLEKHNLQVQIKKCRFFANEISFLGYLVSPGEVRPNPNKIKAILAYPEPKTLKNLKSFLGMANYYRRFIKDYSHHAKPLTDATSLKIPFNFTSECKEAFKTLKEKLAYDVTLVIVDFSLGFNLTSDASDVAIGAVLSQGEPPADRPIQFFSRALTPTQRVYPAHERECLALAEAIKEFGTYIKGRKFVVITDSQCLVYLFSTTHGNKRLLRQAIEIFDLNFDIRFRPGKLNVVADALSRIELTAENDTWQQLPIGEYLKRYAEDKKLVRVITRQRAKMEQPSEQREPKKTNAHAEKHKPFIRCEPYIATDKDNYQHIFNVISATGGKRFGKVVNDNGILPSKELQPISPTQSIITYTSIPIQAVEIESIVMRIVEKIHEEDLEKVVINTDLYTSRNLFPFKWLLAEKLEDRKITVGIHCKKLVFLCDSNDIINALKQHHTTTIGGHMGIQRMLATMKKIYKWHNMANDIKKFVQECQICKQTKPGRLIKSPMQITSVAEHPFDHVNIDFQGPINPKSSDGCLYIFVATDDLTKYSIAIPTLNQTAQVAADCFLEHVILRFGFPTTVTSDNGPAFIADLFKELNSQLKIKQILTSPYNPKANANVERRNRSINEYLRAFTMKKPDSWAQLLPIYMFSYNIAVHSTTGYSPFELLFGRVITLPDSILRKTPIYNYDSYAQLLKRELHDAWQLAKEKIQERKEISKKYYDRAVNDVQIKVGDTIRVKNHVKHGKYDILYTGPYTVVEVPTNKTVVYLDGRKRKRASKDHVKLDKTPISSGATADEQAMIELINTL